MEKRAEILMCNEDGETNYATYGEDQTLVCLILLIFDATTQTTKPFDKKNIEKEIIYIPFSFLFNKSFIFFF